MSDQRISFFISAPSGAGKTTLVEALLARTERLARVVTCTTRTPRPEEENARDYFFVDTEEFSRRRGAGEFLEWAEVHGNLYATPGSEVRRIHGAGDDAILVIDVQGAAAVRDVLDGAVTVFVLPPSRDALVGRLTGRDDTDAATDAATRRRLQVAESEIAHYVGYDYVVINDDFEIAVSDLSTIVRAERCRRARRVDEIEAIRASFTIPTQTATDQAKDERQ